MNARRYSFPMLISFNELALLAVFSVVLFFSFASGRSKREATLLTDQLKQSRAELTEAEKKRADLAEELRKQSRFRHTEAAMNEVRDKLKAAHSVSEIHLAEATKYKDLADRLQKQLKDLITTTQKAKEPAPASRETSIRKELLGLKGDLKNVALVFDQSGSMKGARWKSACELVQTWIDYLDINACVLITFNDTPTRFPEGDALLEMTDSSGAPNNASRASLRNRLDMIQPTGDTNTLDALKVAFACRNIDTIILFTDGKPDLGKPAPLPPPQPPPPPRRIGIVNWFKRENPPVMPPPRKMPPPAPLANASLTQKIYDLCENQMHIRPVPVNTVGLGNYFEGKEYVTFLLTVAEITGGTFIGR